MCSSHRKTVSEEMAAYLVKTQALEAVRVNDDLSDPKTLVHEICKPLVSSKRNLEGSMVNERR